ncbi:MAG: hypothetical protein H0V27_15530 [Pyrinomonadaceae bacterium]|nr:hypothetical protein [Pyrinomonadaceae bacterium]
MKSSEQIGGGKKRVRDGARARISSRITGLQKTTGAFLFGTSEIIGLASAVVLLLAALFSYFYFLAPADRRLSELRTERDKQQRRLSDSTKGIKTGGNAQASVVEISESLRNFESQHLPLVSDGRTALIEELNELIRRNGLRIAAELSFTALDARAPGARTQSGARSSIANLQTIYPGTGINMTLEGEYPNLRRFIKDIESSQNQFIVINDVELESASDSNAARRSLLSLRLNMAAYFQRNVPATAPAPQTNQ